MAFPGLGLITGLINSVSGAVDSVHTSTEEKLQMKAALAEIQNELVEQVLTYEATVIKSQASIIEAEAKSQSWMTRNWRPATMMLLFALIMWIFIVGPTEGITQDNINWLMKAYMLGLGGYVAGRSGEKIAKTVAASKAAEQV